MTFIIIHSLLASLAMSQVERLIALLEEIAVPLVTVDNATIHLVAASPSRVHIHLGGAYAGCPGNGFVERCLLAPLVNRTLPSATLEVTSGLPVPAGAQRLGADDAPGAGDVTTDDDAESAGATPRLRAGGEG